MRSTPPRRLLRAAHGRVVVALSGSETVEQAYALAKLVRHGTDSHDAVLPEEVSGALDAYRLPLSAIADAQVVAVLGDVPLAESAPIVDLWVRKARRNGARIVTSEDDVKDADRIVLIWSGPGGRAGVRVAQLAEKLGLAGKDGCGAFFVPATPNGRGVADAWAAASDARAWRRGLDRPADRLGRRGGRRPERARPRRARRRRDRDLDVPRPRRRLGRPRPARARATSSATAPTSTSKAGCSACAAPRRRPARTSSSGSRSSRRASTSSSAPYASLGLRRGLGALLRRPLVRRGRRARARCAPTRERRRTSTSRRCRSRTSRARACASSATSRSSRGPRSSASPSCSSSGRRPRSSSRAPTPSGAASRRATRSRSRAAAPR